MNSDARPNFESRTCTRCAGKGWGDWVVQHGVCFACQGKGTVLTAKGRRAAEAWVASHTRTITVAQLQAGMLTVYRDGSRTRRSRVLQVVAYTGRPHPGVDVLIYYTGSPDDPSPAALTDTLQVWAD